MSHRSPRRLRAARRPLAIVMLALAAVAASPAPGSGQDHVALAPAVQQDRADRSHSTWKGALTDSLRLLLIEHGTRMLQPETRRGLSGPFFRDYVRSLRTPRAWEDSDHWMINYLGHPVHGAAAARIWLDHLPPGRESGFGSTRYWADRAIATAWASGYSVQFEFGPVSEASIGNIDLEPHRRGWVDHVVTPIGALAVTVAEDALDRYFIAWVERHVDSRVFKVVVRLIFNPSRSLAQAAEGRVPWIRTGRSLR